MKFETQTKRRRCQWCVSPERTANPTHALERQWLPLFDRRLQVPAFEGNLEWWFLRPG